MTRWLIVALTLWAPTAMAEEAPPSPFEFEIVPAQPHAGERVFYRLSWVNRGAEAVRVPKVMLDKLHHTDSYHSYGHYMNRHVRVGRVLVGRPAGEPGAAPPPPALEWITLEPDQAIERHGELSEFFEPCKGGCKAGSYRLELNLGHLVGDDEAPDQIIDTDFNEELAFEIRPTTIPVRYAPGLELTIKRVGPKRPLDQPLKLRATLRNNWRYAIWIPKPGYQFQNYDLRVVKAGRAEETGQRSGGAGQGNWSEEAGILIKPGGHARFDVALEGVGPVEGEEVYLKAVITPISEFQPTGGLAHPHHLDGELVSKEIRLR